MNRGQHMSNTRTVVPCLLIVVVQGELWQPDNVINNVTHASMAELMRFMDPDFNVRSSPRLRGDGLLASCSDDDFKFCSSADSGSKLKCLGDHADQLSSGCKTAFETSIPLLCSAETATHCDVQHTMEQSVLHCLEDHLEELPKSCSDAVIAFQNLINHKGLGALSLETILKDSGYYNEEGVGVHCGQDEIYRSSKDDEVTCKAKCTADPSCLGFTTYINSHCDSCLYYSHDCSHKHLQKTTCTGDIRTYTKVLPKSFLSDTQRQVLHCSSLLVVIILMLRKHFSLSRQNTEKQPLLPARDLPTELEQIL